MAEPIITQRRASSPEEPQDWEGHFYREACAWAREEAVAYLAWLHDRLRGAAGWLPPCPHLSACVGQGSGAGTV